MEMWAVLGCVSPEESGATGEDWAPAWARTPAPHLAPPPTAPHPHTHMRLYFSDLTDVVYCILFFYIF